MNGFVFLQFFACLVILFACEVAAGIFGFMHKDSVRTHTNSDLTHRNTLRTHKNKMYIETQRSIQYYMIELKAIDDVIVWL